MRAVEGAGTGRDLFMAAAGCWLAERAPVVSIFYQEFREEAGRRLEESSQGLPDILVAVWKEIIQLGLMDRRHDLELGDTWARF